MQLTVYYAGYYLMVIYDYNSALQLYTTLWAIAGYHYNSSQQLLPLHEMAGSYSIKKFTAASYSVYEL